MAKTETLLQNPDYLAIWANWMSVIGFPLSVIGLIIAIWQIRTSIRVSEAAKKASEETRMEISRTYIIFDFASSLKIMEEIKTLNRLSAWHIVIERYSQLKTLLISVKNSDHNLAADDESKIQNAIIQIAKLESKIEKHLYRPSTSIQDVVKMNNVMSNTLEKLSQVLTKIRNGIGGQI